jgi:TetR/AcrR family transcriptional repressor of multidrug resistance operon
MRNKDENKEAIIREKAIEMIVEKGFDGLSMQKLAKEAGLSASTIYIYFENREDMLNQLYIKVETEFEQDALKDFDENFQFETGLWHQWINRFNNVRKDPVKYKFYNQFRNSPLIKHKKINDTKFTKTMSAFVKNAVAKNEIIELPVEIFWAIAYGPFYTLIKFHLDQASMSGKPFSLNKRKMKQTFDLVLKALHP